MTTYYVYKAEDGYTVSSSNEDGQILSFDSESNSVVLDAAYNLAMSGFTTDGIEIILSS